MSKCWRYCVSFLNGITVEPMFMFYFISNSIASNTSGNLLLQKACHPGDESEPDYSTPCPDEIAAQRVKTAIGYWTPILDYALPVFFIIFLGTWSDTHGKRRKPLLFLPLSGEIAASVFLMFSSYFFAIPPEVTAALLSGVRGITGGTTLFALGSVTYISDITSLEDRAWRIGLITSLTFIAAPLGIALEGVLRNLLGFFFLFLLCFFLNIVSLIFGIFLMKNIAVEASALKTFEGMCDPSQFILSVKTLFKQRPGYNRLVLWLMGFTAPLFLVCYYGESAVLMLYARNRFYMGETDFGYYTAYKLSTSFIGSFISVLICSKWLKLPDEVIGAMGNVTQVVAAIGMCFATSTWQLYLFPILDFMHGAVFTAGRSLTSKIVEGSELGQVNSFFGVLDALIPVVVLPIYNGVYSLTIETFPGAFYLLSVSIAVVTFSMFIISLIFRRRGETETTLKK